MTGTLEATNSNILLKIKTLYEILEIFNINCIYINSKINTIINRIKDDYEMGSINILLKYFNSSNNIKLTTDSDTKQKWINKKTKYFNIYQTFIRKENIISNLDHVINQIRNNITYICPKLRNDILDLIKVFNNSTINKSVKEVNYGTCTCLNKMDIDSTNSTLVCRLCGYSKELYGTVFEDEQFYFQEGQRVKHGTYDPTKHCRFWVERIQARENTDIDDDVIESIKKCIKLDKIKNKEHITCCKIRRYLRSTNNSKYNEHIPLIRKIITGISPPQLTDYEMQLIHIYFDKVIHIFEDIKHPSKVNCPYHPYFIYKIIDQIIKKNKCDDIRKNQILECIHLQSCDTLINNDLIWKSICVQIPEFIYKPTDKSKFIEY